MDIFVGNVVFKNRTADFLKTEFEVERTVQTQIPIGGHLVLCRASVVVLFTALESRYHVAAEKNMGFYKNTIMKQKRSEKFIR